MLGIHFEPILGHSFSKFSGGACPQARPKKCSAQKIFGPQPSGFRFNPVGRSDTIKKIPVKKVMCILHLNSIHESFMVEWRLALRVILIVLSTD